MLWTYLVKMKTSCGRKAVEATTTGFYEEQQQIVTKSEGWYIRYCLLYILPLCYFCISDTTQKIVTVDYVKLMYTSITLYQLET